MTDQRCRCGVTREGVAPPERTLWGLRGLSLWLEVRVAECAGALQGLGVPAGAEHAGSADPGLGVRGWAKVPHRLRRVGGPKGSL